MKKIALFCLICLLWLLTTPATLAQAPVDETVIPGEIIVRLKPAEASQGSALGISAAEVSPDGRLLRIKVEPGTEAAAIADLQAEDYVEFVGHNHRVQIAETPNDPSFATLWGLESPANNDMDALDAWAIHQPVADEVIAIIDTGVDLDHIDLVDNLVAGYDFVNSDSFPDDDNGHGTHVAGMAGAMGYNGIGVIGLNWSGKIMPLKVLDNTGDGSTFDVAQAIYYAVDRNVRILNLSLGGRGTRWPCDWPELEEAFDYAVANGTLVFVAAGNSGQNGINCPAAYESAIAVGSTSESGGRSSFSNYGPRLAITAPGSNIYSTSPNNSYTTKNGTSMATAYVSGLAGLIWSAYPDMTAAEVWQAMITSADDLSLDADFSCSFSFPEYVGQTGFDPCFGYGRINAARALQNLAMQTSPPAIEFLLTDESGPRISPIQITTTSDPITWTAQISPAVAWLSLQEPSGGVSTSAAPGSVSIQAIQPPTYTITSTTVIITGHNANGASLGSHSTTIQLRYIPELFEHYLPIIRHY